MEFSSALLIFLILLPIEVLIAIITKITSPGPAIYKQIRVGENGREFVLYKFRTMVTNAEQFKHELEAMNEMRGPVFKVTNDPRVTPVGRWIRRFRLDELPQLFNVLRGEMAVVGPRPERPEFVKWLSQEIPFYGMRHMVRPGITGWAQIRYKYGSTVEDAREKLQYDLFYIKNASLGLDLLIMFQTVKTVLLRRGAQ